jgi:hypothetical protein
METELTTADQGDDQHSQKRQPNDNGDVTNNDGPSLQHKRRRNDEDGNVNNNGGPSREEQAAVSNQEKAEVRNEIHDDDSNLIKQLKRTTRTTLTRNRFYDICDNIDAAVDANQLNTPNSTGDTALTIACGNNLPTVVEYLLNVDADPHVVNHDGDTPISLAFAHLKTYDYPMPIEIVKRLEVPGANRNKQCVLWIYVHGCCDTLECGAEYTPQTKRQIDEAAEKGKVFTIPPGMKVTRYSMPPGYSFATAHEYRMNIPTFAKSMADSIMAGVAHDKPFDPTKVLEIINTNADFVQKWVHYEEEQRAARPEPADAPNDPKYMKKLLKLREGPFFVDAAKSSFSTPTAFQENGWMYEKYLEATAPIFPSVYSQFDETGFYMNLSSNLSSPVPPNNRMGILEDFILRFSDTSPMFDLPIKLIHPTGVMIRNRDFHTKLSDVLRTVYNDGFTDVTIVDMSCFGFRDNDRRDIDFHSPEWHASSESLKKVQEDLGKRLGGTRRLRQKRLTRKRRRISRRRRSPHPPQTCRNRRRR